MLGGPHHAFQQRAVKVQQRLQHVLAETDLASSANSLLAPMATATEAHLHMGTRSSFNVARSVVLVGSFIFS